jgi:hypothetical protein
MTSYKRLVLLKLLEDIYPDTPVACDTTYASINLYKPTEPLVPESTIKNKYPAYNLAYNLRILRRERNARLSQSDMYGLSDFPFPSEANKQAWLAYRQALRNITTSYPAPETDENDNLIGIVWPAIPQ